MDKPPMKFTSTHEHSQPTAVVQVKGGAKSTRGRAARQPDHLDAWGAYFSPRRPLIQWVCSLSDAEAAAAMRALGLQPSAASTAGGPAFGAAPDRDGPALWDESTQ